MAEKNETPVRIIGSRELHQKLPSIMRELEHDDARYVLTVHGKPRAVLIGAAPFLRMMKRRGSARTSSEALVGLQLSVLLGDALQDLPLEDLGMALEATGGNGRLKEPTKDGRRKKQRN